VGGGQDGLSWGCGQVHASMARSVRRDGELKCAGHLGSWS
jgi:hypothetical protein